MSFIVKGMEMPLYCGECNFLEFGDEVKDDFCLVDFHCVKNEFIRNKNCPLVELPEKHGRLIDADKVLRNWKSDLNKLGKIPTDLIKDAVTVIEAEGQE